MFPVDSTTKSAAPVPEIAPETVIEAIFPTFVTVTSRTLVVACAIVPNASDVGDTDTSVVAVPVSGITGLEPPLVVSVSVPVLLPTAVGSYSTGSTQLAPAAMLVLQVFPVEEIRNPAPAIAGESVKAVVPVFVIVKFDVSVVP